MVDRKAQALAELARRELARRHLADFVLYTYPEYIMGWVHRELCDALEWLYNETVAKRSPRLLVTMPPRHGKSELVSRRFPAWAFGRDPKMQIISASYSSELATTMSRSVQSIMDDYRYINVFPGSRLSSPGFRGDSSKRAVRQADKFDVIGHLDSYRAAGVNGGITGMGCNLLLIDDPFKNRRDADSETIRQSVWDWYASTAYIRVAPGGGVMLTHTRWHQDDLAGRLLEQMKQGGDQWRIINFPAIAEHQEPHRNIGEALHPERYPIESLRAIEKTQGSYEFSALYQQNPASSKGNIVKREWLRYYERSKPLPTFERLLQSWDCTFKGDDGNDYVVGTVWGKSGANCYLLDIVRERMDFVQTIAAMRAMSAKWPQAVEKLIEDKANGSAIISVLRSEVQGLIAVNPDKDKASRLRSVTPLFEAGNVFFPEPMQTPWVGPLIDELVSFPTAKHDDQVDSISQALNRLIQNVATAESIGQINAIFRAKQRAFPNG